MNFIKSLLERSAGTGTSATAANSHLLKDVPFASTDDADVFARYENETNTENASKWIRISTQIWTQAQFEFCTPFEFGKLDLSLAELK